MVKSFVQTLFYNSLQDYLSSNINSSTGSREHRKVSVSSFLKVYYNDSKGNIIYIVNSKSRTFSEGSFGSYTDTTILGSYIYIAKSESDKKKTISTLRNGEIPTGLIGPSVMHSYPEEHYTLGNDCSLKLQVTSEDLLVKRAVEKELIVLEPVFYDDFVDSDGYHIYMSEEFYNYRVTLTLIEFKGFIKEPSYRRDMMWNHFDIERKFDTEDKFGNNILETDGFGNLLRSSFENLEIVDESNDIDKHLKAAISDAKLREKNNDLEKRKSLADAEKFAEERKSSKAREELYIEDLKGPLNTKSICSKLANKTFEKEVVNLMNDLHRQVYGTEKKLSYSRYMKYIMNKYNAGDSVTIDFVFRCIKAAYSQVSDPSLAKLNSRKLDPIEAFSRLSKDLNLPDDYFKPVLDSPIRIPLQLLQTLID